MALLYILYSLVIFNQLGIYLDQVSFIFLFLEIVNQEKAQNLKKNAEALEEKLSKSETIKFKPYIWH
jgi:hypothetical protein